MSANTAKIVLESQKLRWSCPSQFNDINELQRMPDFSPTITECKGDYLRKIIDIAFYNLQPNKPLSTNSMHLILLIKTLIMSGVHKDAIYRDLISLEINLPNTQDELRKNIENYNNGDLRIICLSEDGNNDVMWAHYGENHTGCMLEFGHIKEKDTPFQMARKIKYKDKITTLGSAIDFLLFDEKEKLLKETVDAIFFTKTENWAYEKEWRVMTQRPNEDKYYSDFEFYSSELISLTLAARIDNKTALNLTSYVREKYPECLLYKIQSINGSSNRIIING